MLTEIKPKQKNLYDTDYNLWVIETVKKLQSKDFNSLDLENLIEEVSDLSRREKKAIKSLLTRLFEHLLKLKYWESEKEYNQNHWKKEIRNFRKQIKDDLKASPSLKRHLNEIFKECYQDAKELVSDVSELPLNTFPVSSIGNVEQILDENWFS
jgi:DNA-directed RNA polymerase subunit L